MSKVVEVVAKKGLSISSTPPQGCLNWVHLQNERIVKAISRWNVHELVAIIQYSEAMKAFFDAFGIEEARFDEETVQSAREAFIEAHAEGQAFLSEEEPWIDHILTADEERWRRCLLAAANDDMEEVVEEFSARCGAMSTASLFFATLIDRSLADILTYGLIAESEKVKPDVFLRRMIDTAESAVLDVDETISGRDRFSHAVVVKLTEEETKARLNRVIEFLSTDVTQVQSASSLALVRSNLYEKPTEVFAPMSWTTQLNANCDEHLTHDHRYVERALIDIVAQDFRSAHWEEVVEAVEALTSAGELPPRSRCLLSGFGEWAELQRSDDPVTVHTLGECSIPVVRELHTLTEICQSIRRKGLRFVIHRADAHEVVSQEEDRALKDGDDVVLEPVDHEIEGEVRVTANPEPRDPIGQALAAIVVDQEYEDARKMVELGDISDNLLKGNGFAKSLGTWLRTIQAIILFRRGRYAYAKRVATYARTLVGRWIDEYEALEEMLNRIIADCERAE